MAPVGAIVYGDTAGFVTHQGPGITFVDEYNPPPDQDRTNCEPLFVIIADGASLTN